MEEACGCQHGCELLWMVLTEGCGRKALEALNIASVWDLLSS